MTEAKVYSVMADEARDGLCEQLAVGVRYVAPDGEVKKRFLALKKLDHFDAKSITDAIEEVLVSSGLDGLTCVAQAYDGASVMSGAKGGVQARFRKTPPSYICALLCARVEPRTMSHMQSNSRSHKVL